MVSLSVDNKVWPQHCKTSCPKGNDRSTEDQQEKSPNVLNSFQVREQLFSGPSKSNVSSLNVLEIIRLQAFTHVIVTSNSDDDSMKMNKLA